ncbi:MAG: hypothetical protein R2827_11520 [Bdellovibrionales bacterium]
MEVENQNLERPVPESVSFTDLGIIEYKKALDIQLKYLARVQENPNYAHVLLCTHPPVVTLGRSSKPEDVLGWDGEIVEISRGGRATYHGLEQLVVYPIIDLKQPVSPFPKMDLHKFMRCLEERVIRCLKFYGVEAESKQTVQYDTNGRKVESHRSLGG